jgi:hypothetical protein
MRLSTRLFVPLLAMTAIALCFAASAFAASAQIPTYPYDMSPAGMRAAIHNGDPAAGQMESLLPEATMEAVRGFVAETRRMGLAKRASILFVPGPTNVQANNPAGDRVGETQSEVSVAVFRDTVVIGWNDSQGFIGAPITLSSYAYSTDGGATFTDGGNVPLAAAGDQAFGDTDWDTDEQGNWYLNQIYTRATSPAQQDIGVHHARFNNVGVLVLDPPVMASIGTSATGNLDKCLLACDRVTGNVYVAYTRFTANPQIEIVRSTTLGATWDPPVVIDNTAVPTSSKQAANPICGPNGEVYVVWEKGANSIFCPDAAGNISSFNAQIAFSRSLDFGVSYSPLSVISNVVTDFLAGGPGDLRDRGNEFPDIAVDMSNGCYRGNLYVTWHDSAPWTTNTSAGPIVVESGVNNNNPTTPDLFAIGDDVTGTITPAGDLDYWQFSAVQGQALMIDVLPQGFVCGVSGTTRQMRVRLWAVTPVFPNPTGFPDSMLAGSFVGSFENRIVWTAPATGNYLIRLQISGGTTTGTYTMRVRPLAFAPGQARDTRDVVVSRSSDMGSTWSAAVRVNDDPAGLENRRPFIACNNQGEVTAYWHDSRDAGLGSSASLTGVYGTLSRDGGATWLPNFCVTDELSFFSFNTLAVPNLGDYNMAAAGGTAVFHPAWSDQRISTGDVRTPGTNTYTAGRGPEAFTTGIAFFHQVACPPDTFASPGAAFQRVYRIQNTGTVQDAYNYNVTDTNGWVVGVGGTTPLIMPGSFFDVFVTFNVPIDCNPNETTTIFSVLPVGSPVGGCVTPTTCTSRVLCDLATATLLGRFDVVAAAGGIDLDWASDATGEVKAWNLYRSTTEIGAYVRINADPIAMGIGGEFHFRDVVSGAGTFYYRLGAVMTDGSERVLETRSVSLVNPVVFSASISGANPFATTTSLAYALPKPARVSVELFSVTGQKVRTLVSAFQAPGNYRVELGRVDAAGRRLNAGVYLVRVNAGGESKSLRVIALD